MPRNIIRLKTVKERTGKSRSTIYRGMAAGTFPIAVKLGENSIGWYENEITAHVDNLPRVTPQRGAEKDEAAA